MFVITADQVRSVRTGDRVPAALDALAALGGSAGGIVRAFERTVGDEIQAVVSSAETVVDVVTTLTREGGWRIGIGIGPVDRPLPRSTRAATGPAFLLARGRPRRQRPTCSLLRGRWAHQGCGHGHGWAQQGGGHGHQGALQHFGHRCRWA